MLGRRPHDAPGEPLSRACWNAVLEKCNRTGNSMGIGGNISRAWSGPRNGVLSRGNVICSAFDRCRFRCTNLTFYLSRLMQRGSLAFCLLLSRSRSGFGNGVLGICNVAWNACNGPCNAFRFRLQRGLAFQLLPGSMRPGALGTRSGTTRLIGSVAFGSFNHSMPLKNLSFCGSSPGSAIAGTTNSLDAADATGRRATRRRSDSAWRQTRLWRCGGSCAMPSLGNCRLRVCLLVSVDASKLSVDARDRQAGVLCSKRPPNLYIFRRPWMRPPTKLVALWP